MPGTTRRLLAIGSAAAIVVATLALVAIGSGAYIVYTHTNAQFVDAAAGDAQIAAQRSEFEGQEPLIELRGVDEPLVHRRPDKTRREIAALHVLSYDPRARKLVRVDIPGWFLRLASAHGSIRLANLEMFNDERDRVTLEDLERHGPGLIVETTGRSHVLVWTE